MNCKPGDLAYVVVPHGFDKLLDGKFVDVGTGGRNDMSPRQRVATHDASGRKLWNCTFHAPFEWQGRKVFQEDLLDAWLRPIGNPGEDAADETLLILPAPSAELVAA